MKLWLLRHARVELETGLCYGASDVPANAVLTQQAAQAAAALLPPGLPVWVSGLDRAQQLAQALGRLRPDLGEAVIDTRLNEMHFGHWELQPWSYRVINMASPTPLNLLRSCRCGRVNGLSSTWSICRRVLGTQIGMLGSRAIARV